MDANVPLRQTCYLLINNAFEHGEFALSPPDVPSEIWCEVASEIAHDRLVALEVRIDSKTDRVILRANRGLPLSMATNSHEAEVWRETHPSWAENQHVWIQSMSGRSR